LRAVTLFCALSLCPASVLAQQSLARFQGAKLDESSKKLGIGKPKSDLSGLGYTIAPGVLFQPSLTMESGYNSNPDELFIGGEGSPYGLTNATGVFGFIKETGATTLTLRGTFLQYDGDIEDSSRWDSGVALDNAYAVGPGMIATFGAYYLRDEISFVASDNEGAYGQLAYKEAEFETFARLKADQIGYLGSVAGPSGADPLDVLFLQPSQFNVQRIEGVTGFIFRPQGRIGFYTELGGANLNYYTQNVENLLDRDATEFWAITGFRFNLHPTVVLDTGWRFNVRQTDDRRVHEQSSNYFDGRLIWTPVETLRFTAEIDRSFVEPVSALAVVGDKIHYGASVFYLARPGLETGVALRHDQIDQIGDSFDYHETEISFSMSYQWSEKTVVYGLVGNEFVEEQTTGLDYNKLYVGAGARIKF
jgi:hypothetical protein